MPNVDANILIKAIVLIRGHDCVYHGEPRALDCVGVCLTHDPCLLCSPLEEALYLGDQRFLLPTKMRAWHDCYTQVTGIWRAMITCALRPRSGPLNIHMHLHVGLIVGIRAGIFCARDHASTLQTRSSNDSKQQCPHTSGAPCLYSFHRSRLGGRPRMVGNRRIQAQPE